MLDLMRELGGFGGYPLVKGLVKLRVELSRRPSERCLMKCALYSTRVTMPLALVKVVKNLRHLEELTWCPFLFVILLVQSRDFDDCTI